MNWQIIWALATAFAAGEATACSCIVQTQLGFDRDSADLSRPQIFKLSEWLSRSYIAFPQYKGASVETGASGAVTSKTKALAKKRAANTARALRMLLQTDLPITTVARGYRLPVNGLGDSNDFASLQLYPDVDGLKLPDCNPVPISGSKP